MLPHVLKAESAASSPLHGLYWALACWAVALVMTFAGFVATVHSGPWFAAAQPYRLDGSRLTLRGGGRAVGPRIVMEVPGPGGATLAAINLDAPLEAGNYRFVTVRASGNWPSGGVSFIWRVRGREGAVRRVELSPAGGRIHPVELAAIDGWTGSVIGVGVLARGEFNGPFAIESIELGASSGWTTVGGLLSDWLEFEPWDGGSIHFMSGGNPALKAPLPLFLGISFAGAIAIYLFLIVLGHTRFRPQVVLAIALLGWAVVDARWQLNLWRQLDITRWQFAGKSWEDKRLAAGDGHLFRFMREARAKIGDAPARVFVFAEGEYERMRGAYHLYPANVAAMKGLVTILPAQTFRAGDVLVLYRKRGIEYNAAEKRLRWDGSQGVKADMVMFSEGSAVFRVLGPG